MLSMFLMYRWIPGVCPSIIYVVSMLRKLYDVSFDTWRLPQYFSVESMLTMLFMYHWITGVCPSIFVYVSMLSMLNMFRWIP